MQPRMLPRNYIYCTRIAPDDTFGQFARRFRSDPAWKFFEIDASHSPNVTAPEALARLLDQIAQMRAVDQLFGDWFDPSAVSMALISVGDSGSTPAP